MHVELAVFVAGDVDLPGVAADVAVLDEAAACVGVDDEELFLVTKGAADPGFVFHASHCGTAWHGWEVTERRDIYFDLDGTLTDPFEGITLSIQHALTEMKAHVPTQKELGKFIGPPLRIGFQKLLGTDDQDEIARAIAIYRSRFSVVGLFENAVYAGVPSMLEALSARGHRIFMATSKPRVFAERIAEHFQFARSFTQIFGSELDGRFDDKRELLAHALATHPPTKGQPIMIGDREFDVQGAHANRLVAVGVSYGYGSREELEEARADYICDSPNEVTERISEIA